MSNSQNIKERFDFSDDKFIIRDKETKAVRGGYKDYNAKSINRSDRF